MKTVALTVMVLLIGVAGYFVVMKESSVSKSITNNNKQTSVANSVDSRKFFPVIITEKLQETKKFYVTLLGATPVFEADWYVQLVSPAGLEIGILAANHSSQPDFLHQAYKGIGMVLTFEVENAEEEQKKVKSSGLKIVYNIKTEEWGQRHFMLHDPNGVTVDIVEHLQQ